MRRDCFRRFSFVAVAIATAAIAASELLAQDDARGGASVNLPYVVNDGRGEEWVLQRFGWLGQQGNMPLYGQGAMLTVNGNQPVQRNNSARLDAKTGEIVFERLVAAPLAVTRRVLINKDEGWIRYVDVFSNPTAQDVTANVQIQSNLNFGVNSAEVVTDPKQEDRQLAWVAQTGAGRTVVELFAGPRAKSAPAIQFAEGNSFVQATWSLHVPAGREVAIVHARTSAGTQEAGIEWVSSMKATKLMAGLSPEVRRIVVNFCPGGALLDDRELLRGDAFDVIELRTNANGADHDTTPSVAGDQIMGTLKPAAYKLSTLYGQLDVPAEHVVALINVGSFRPRQLLVTADGQVFGGTLQADALAIELSSGQVTQVPLSQISRVGYRKRAGEPEEWTYEKPMVFLRSGERLAVAQPDAPTEVLTRYGSMKLSPSVVASIDFAPEGRTSHLITLTDGSHFGGLVVGDTMNFQLAGTGGVAGKTITLGSGALSRVQLASPESGDAAAAATAPATKSPNLADGAGQIELSDEDVLIGALAGELQLDTAFDTLKLNAAELRSLTRIVGAQQDVQVVLWDGTSVSGQLRDPALSIELASGVRASVPVALVQRYVQPNPTPSPAVVEQIKKIVNELGASDWQKRDAAQQRLISMGSVVARILRGARSSAMPEAQQRIDAILSQLEASSKPSAAVVEPSALEHE